MDDLATSAEHAIVACQRALGPSGRLSTALPGFVARSQQIELATAFAKAIVYKQKLVAEAGTGTGKTYAYLIPCLQSGKKIILSTATKTLQDQLFYKDVPKLINALGLSLRTQNLKGRANYLCRYRIALHMQEGRFAEAKAASDLVFVAERLAKLKDGERSELPELSEDSPVWPYVTSTVDNCLGSECPEYQSCFLTKARKRAMEADLVIINHHLFFADSRLKEQGFGELLPGAEVVVFDEAHQLAEIAASFKSERLSTRQLQEVLDDLIKEWPVLDLANQPFKQLSFDMADITEALFQALAYVEDRQAWETAVLKPAFQTAWANLAKLLQQVLTCIEEAGLDEHAGVQRCKKRIEALLEVYGHFTGANTNLILWIERFKHTLVCHATPFQIADDFKKLLSGQNCAYLFTSATLTIANSFDCFINPLGLQDCNSLVLPSPFDYQDQALLYLPRSLPDPNHARYHEFLVARTKPVIEACGGRSFFLFTSHRALKLVAGLLVDTLNYPLLIQGEEAKPILLSRFRQLGNAILLGTDTFWEGVDVKGAALSCVIIDKLPFASPKDPIVRGKMAHFKSQGLSGFDECLLPEAVLALKQGVGRLIRDVEDRGVLLIADPRLTSRDYGRRIFASLPPLKKTRDEQCVLHFIKQLALENETISN